MKRFLFALLFPALFLAGCKGEVEGPPIPGTITVSPDNVSLSGDAQVTPAAKSVTVDCKKNSGNPDFITPWTLTSNATWLKLSLDPSGNGADVSIESVGQNTVYLVAEANTDPASRSAEIFLNNETTAAVTVTQAGFIPGTITVTPGSIPSLNGESHTPVSQNLTVTCSRYNGDPDPSAAWSLASSQTWLKLSLNSDGSEAVVSLNSTGTRDVYLVAEENNTGALRTANITLNGGSTPALTVSQEEKIVLPPLPAPGPGLLDGITGAGELPSTSASYVGAFWRAGQTGERVIRTSVGANAGDWTATVAWYGPGWDLAAGDGVILAAGDSPDPNIRHATDAPADAENYRLGGTLATVSGTVDANGHIVFRIGLTRAFRAYDADNNPARYAVVLLAYGDGKKQKIFLRQGEGADYIMRPGDKNGVGENVGGTENRSFARKFAPYNLTASDAQWAANPGGSTVASHPQLAVKGGVFVQYPSQAGAYFQGASNAQPRRAYSPAYLSEITDWPTSDRGPQYWNPASDETCPDGYRRPQDGGSSTEFSSSVVAGSEIRQSLWLNPLDGNGTTSGTHNDNTALGYYADGYFDRRPISGNIVSAKTKDVAYVGRLFFNPLADSDSYNVSIFCPFPGYRTTAASVANVATRIYLWTSSSTTANNAGCVYITTGAANPHSQNRAFGFSIRCVKE